MPNAAEGDLGQLSPLFESSTGLGVRPTRLAPRNELYCRLSKCSFLQAGHLAKPMADHNRSSGNPPSALVHGFAV